jgi:xylulokinase
MNTVLGVDLGTQGLKAVFYDYDARETVAAASAPLTVTRDEDGSAEQHADGWTAALSACLRQVPGKIRESVQAIGVSGQQHGFVAVDAEGRVLIPVKLWCDTSTQAEADAITEACGGRARCIELAGNPVLTGYTAPKILWFRKQHPELYRRMSRILLPHDYLNYVMTGETCMEYGDASGTGLLDVRNRQWSEPLLAAVDGSRDLKECLPPLVGAGGFIGATTGAFAAAFGLPAGVPVATGGGDNMMAAIGTGNVTAGKLTMSLGSSGTVCAYSPSPVVDRQGEIAAFCSSTDGWLPLVCTMNCTLGTELVSALVGVPARDLDSEIGQVEAGSGGLVTVPFFNGERTPNLPNAKGCVLGLSSRNCSRGHLLRSTVEGATFAIRYGLDRLAALGVTGNDIVLTGGGSNSTVWRQIVADICRLPVTILEQEEGASFGAALQALWTLRAQSEPGLGIDGVVGEHLQRSEARCTEPDPTSADVYTQRYDEYRNAVRQIAPLYLD